MTSCVSCGFDPSELHEARIEFSKKPKPPVFLCTLCYSTHAGNATLYPDQYPEGKVLRHMCYLANVILAELRGRHAS